MTSLFLYLSATIYREKESKDMDENKAKEEQTKVSEETNVAVDNNEETTKAVEENLVDAEETETEEDQNEERNPQDDFGGETPRNKKPTKQILVGVIAIALVFACIAGVASCSGMVAHPTNTPSPTPTVIPSASPTPKPTPSAKTEQKKEDKKEDKKDTLAKKEEPKKETTVSVNNGKKQQNNTPAKAPVKQPSAPQHVHNWQPVYITVHHDAQYQTVHHDAVTETKWIVDQPYYEKVVCMGCGQEFDSVQEWDDHGIPFELQGDYFSHSSYTVKSYPEKGHNETVVVTPAWDEQVQTSAPWDEQVVSGYQCSCGARK